MILNFIFDNILRIIEYFVDLLEITPLAIPDWAAHFMNLFLKCLAFFPFDVWAVVFSNIVFWFVIHFAWAVIEWIYIKIPGVN